MDKQAPTAVGVDFGGTSIKLGVCRGADLLETDEPIPTQGHRGPEALIRIIAERDPECFYVVEDVGEFVHVRQEVVLRDRARRAGVHVVDDDAGAELDALGQVRIVTPRMDDDLDVPPR